MLLTFTYIALKGRLMKRVLSLNVLECFSGLSVNYNICVVHGMYSCWYD